MFQPHSIPFLPDLSFTTFVKVVELQLLDINTPDAEPCDFSVSLAWHALPFHSSPSCSELTCAQDLLEALQDLRTSQTDLEESQTEWTELYGPPLDDHAMNIDEVSSAFLRGPRILFSYLRQTADDSNIGSTHQSVRRRYQRGLSKMQGTCLRRT